MNGVENCAPGACIGCMSTPEKTPSIPGVFREESILKSTEDGGGGGGGGGVIGFTVGTACGGIEGPGLTELACFLEDSPDAEGSR